MTGLNAIAQWLLGGGGSVLKFILYLIVAWILVGALPRMRADAAQKVPVVRGAARARMREHAKRSRKSGRGKPAEWWGWTAAWGVIAAAHEGARFGGYMITSAWRGWGDHRRRVKALREKYPWRKPGARAPGGGMPPPSSPPPPPPPPDGGPSRPDRPGGPSREAEPPQAPEANRPSEPPQREPRATEPPQRAGEPEPAYSGAGGNGAPEYIPLPPPGNSAGRNNEGAPVADSEASNLEAALHIVGQMQNEARRALDNALAEKERARKALASAEGAANGLAQAGVSGPAMDAFVRYHEAMEVAENAAASEVVACEMAVEAADAARGALVRHQEAADQLAATGGAADSTEWYGAR